jgi:transposase
VLVTGVPWRVLPREIGCSSVTAWRRLRDWQAAGVWDRLHRELLRRRNAVGRLDWSAGVVDGSHIRALRGDKYRRELWRRGVKPVIARRCTEHGSGLGRVRWVVERTFAGLHNFRRLWIRCERDAGLRYALLSLGCSLICWRHIQP